MNVDSPIHRSALLALAFLVGGCVAKDAGPAVEPASVSRIPGVESAPLVVLVVVDQLRADLFNRYDDLFTGGFRRLRDGGAVFVNATHDHARTVTAVGHATLSTGVYPSRHGIVGNNWTETRDGEGTERVYALADARASIVGYPRLPGRSPANIRTEGLADWVESVNPGAKIVSVSRKDRAAISLAAHQPGHVYWILEPEGQFTTSDYYRRELPDWVARYNQTRLGELYSDSVWTSEVPAEARGRSRPDTASFEWDGVHTHFPHRAHLETDPQNSREYNRWYTRTPGGDRAVLELSEIAVTELGLGQGAGPDLLAISFSAVDYVGHRFGPLSREQLDNLLRLDRVLGELMTFLDESVGPGRWVMGFSADHGVASVPEGDPYFTRMSGTERSGLLAAVEEYVAGGPTDGTISPEWGTRIAALDVIERATPYAVLRGDEPVDSITQLQRNGFFEGRHQDAFGLIGLEAIPPEGILVDDDAAGHGTPYHYDRWVPLILFGPGIEAGTRTERVATVDLAPTLAALVGIRAPEGLDGRDLLQR